MFERITNEMQHMFSEFHKHTDGWTYDYDSDLHRKNTIRLCIAVCDKLISKFTSVGSNKQMNEWCYSNKQYYIEIKELFKLKLEEENP